MFARNIRKKKSRNMFWGGDVLCRHGRFESMGPFNELTFSRARTYKKPSNSEAPWKTAIHEVRPLKPAQPDAECRRRATCSRAFKTAACFCITALFCLCWPSLLLYRGNASLLFALNNWINSTYITYLLTAYRTADRRTAATGNPQDNRHV